jgi:hypothetical protein
MKELALRSNFFILRSSFFIFVFVVTSMNRLPNLLSLLLITLIAANYFAPFADLDFGWQVRTGERIVQTGLLQPPEAFSYTIHGSHVPDFEWLYEVVLYLVWSGFGFGGLKFLRLILVATPLLLVARRLRLEGVRPYAITLVLFLAIFVLAPVWNLRPLYCTTIGLLLVWGWLHDHCTGRRPLSWWLPMTMLLWGNLHPGVIAGQGMLLAAICWEWLNRWIWLNTPLTTQALRRLTLIGSLGLAASLICPGPIERLLYPFRPELRHPIQRIFAEMQPLYSFLSMPPYATVLVYLLAALVLLTIVLRFRQYRLWEVAVLGCLGMLANLAFRSLQDWLLMMLAVGVPHVAVVLADAARRNRRRPWLVCLLRLDRSARRVLAGKAFCFQPAWPLGAAAALLVITLIPPLAQDMPVRYGEEWPADAVTYIEQAGLKGRFFGPPDYGAFLIWRLPGQARAYTDTRGFFYPPELLEDSHFVPQLGPGWRRRLERVLNDYGTDYFLLETTGARAALGRLVKEHGLSPLYEDERTVLLTATQIRQATNAAFAQRPD